MSGNEIPFRAAFAIATKFSDANIDELQKKLIEADAAIEELQKSLCISGTLNGPEVAEQWKRNLEALRVAGRKANDIDIDPFYNQLYDYADSIKNSAPKLNQYLQDLLQLTDLATLAELIRVVINLYNGKEVYEEQDYGTIVKHVSLTENLQIPPIPENLFKIAQGLQPKVFLVQDMATDIKTARNKYIDSKKNNNLGRLKQLGLAIPKSKPEDNIKDKDDKSLPLPIDIKDMLSLRVDPKQVHLTNAVHAQDVALALEVHPKDFGLQTLAKYIAERDALQRLLQLMRAMDANSVVDLIGTNSTGFETAWQVAVNFVALKNDTIGEPHIDYADELHSEELFKNLIADNIQILEKIFPSIFEKHSDNKIKMPEIIGLFKTFVKKHSKINALPLEEQWQLLDRLNTLLLILLQKIIDGSTAKIQFATHKSTEPKYVFLALLLLAQKNLVDTNWNVTNFAFLAGDNPNATAVNQEKLKNFEFFVYKMLDTDIRLTMDLNNLLKEKVPHDFRLKLERDLEEFKPDSKLYKTPYVTAFAESLQQNITLPEYLNKMLQREVSESTASTATSETPPNKVSPFSSKNR